MAAYVQAVRDKDPPQNVFLTDIQRIVHDADCLDIIRVHGRLGFNPRFLCFYKMFPELYAYMADQADPVADDARGNALLKLI